MRFKLLLSSALLLLLSACSSIPKVEVNAPYLNDTVQTTVDSEIARYYLENYLQQQYSQPDLDQQITHLYKRYENKLPDHNDLKAIAKQFSNDFAAIFFAEQIIKLPHNQHWLERFQFYLENPDDDDNLKTLAKHYRILFMPGWNYVDNASLTGADLALPRELVSQIGIENHFLTPPSNGSVEQGAQVLTKAIQDFSLRDKKIIILGASAAGPAIHLSLGEQLNLQQQQKVAAWINLGGILQGSPLVDYFQQWPQSMLMNLVLWFKGWDYEHIASMSTEISRERFKRLKTAESLLTVNYLALGLSGNLSALADNIYPIIMDHGPNDGLTLLPDAIAPNSATLIAVNSDHYFGEDPLIEEKTIALLKTLMDFLESEH